MTEVTTSHNDQHWLGIIPVARGRGKGQERERERERETRMAGDVDERVQFSRL
jgi:hypothetical protein